MLSSGKESGDYLYRQVIDLISGNIESGTLKPGDRLPSLRRMSTRIGVSIPTVRQAYLELERQRRVESRPQSGYYVRSIQSNELVHAGPKLERTARPVTVGCRSLMDRVFDGIHRPGVLPFAITNPCMARPAARALHRTMKRVMARAEERSLGYAPGFGDPGLRRQIAWRYLDTLGGAVEPEDICITNGGQEALLLALAAVAEKGDVIAVESPTYHGLLELIDSLGMLAVEVQTCPEEGVELDALARTLDAHPVKACMFSTTLNNPLGVGMPDAKREALVRLLEAREVPLIEDDVYGELRFDGRRPTPAAFYSTDGPRNARPVGARHAGNLQRGDRPHGGLLRDGGVLTVGSFSKTAAPGYRIGWLLTGRYRERISRLKRSYSCTSGLLQQLTLAEFLAGGEYDRYLKALRPVLRCNAERMSAAVACHFPPETRTSKPIGGSVLWLELPSGIDSEELFEIALRDGISIAPGRIFSPAGRYRNCIRLSFGHPWTDAVEDGLARLGRRVHELARRRRSH